MIANPKQARDEILTTFRTAWLADETSAEVPVVWPDIPGVPPQSGPWARVAVQHVTGEQATIGGERGQRRFRKTGIVTVQVFTEHGNGQGLADDLAGIAQVAFEGETTSGGVIFRNVRITEIGPTGQWFQTNVLAEFEYDTIR